MPTLRVATRLDDIPAEAWDALHDGSNPFLAHAFLAGLERHGCIRAAYGWTPHHLGIWDGARLTAAVPGYLKDNSHGEFVFDHAWAHAYAQHGLDYFPKWLCAVPYSPVPGPRLLARDPSHRRLLLDAMVRLAVLEGASSAHVNFHRDDEATAFTEDWLARIDVQYHWRNEAGWRDFDDYLAAFDHKHRKNIRQERAKVARAGITFRVVNGADASDADLAIAHRFDLQTFAEYGYHPALTLPFLRHLRDTMPGSLVLIAGGQGKGQDFKPLAQAFRGKVRHVVHEPPEDGLVVQADERGVLDVAVEPEAVGAAPRDGGVAARGKLGDGGGADLELHRAAGTIITGVDA